MIITKQIKTKRLLISSLVLVLSMLLFVQFVQAQLPGALRRLGSSVSNVRGNRRKVILLDFSTGMTLLTQLPFHIVTLIL